jgi:hypothetical protein
VRVKVKINNDDLAKALGVLPGSIVPVETKSGVPVVREWRNRFRDARHDGCISILKPEPKTKTKEVK